MLCAGWLVTWLPEMNENDSSGAHPGLEPNSTAQPAAGSLRTAASALLYATDIWATDLGAAASAQPNGNCKVSEKPATIRVLAASEVLAAFKSLSSSDKRVTTIRPADNASVARARSWPPQKLSLALQGGGTFAAFTWGVLERLLEEPDCRFEAISGASAGALNAAIVACGLVEGGRERARKRLAQFWQLMVQEASFRSLMLLGGFSPAGSSVAFGATLRSGGFDPLDLDPLRQTLARHINFPALRHSSCPKLLIAATRVRDGGLRMFRNQDITADVLLASSRPPLPHCAVDIEGEAYWDGGYAANPPLIGLIGASEAADVLVVQAVPSRDGYVPITMAAIDRRLDQITANSALNAEIAAIEWARRASPASASPRICRIAAEDEIDGLAQRSAVDLGHSFITHLHRSGRNAADRWLRQTPPGSPGQQQKAAAAAIAQPALA